MGDRRRDRGAPHRRNGLGCAGEQRLQRGESGASASPGATGSPGPTPTPQPTEFETPSPGSTDAVVKPDAGDEVPIDEPAPPVQGVVSEVTALEAITAGNDIPGAVSYTHLTLPTKA